MRADLFTLKFEGIYPVTDLAFSTLTLSDALLENLTSLGYQTMTPIQAQSLPSILNGQDLIGQAKTGSGKTAAFALGLLAKLDVTQYKPQALIICPTRELADQVAGEVRRLARSIPNVKVKTVCGGVPFGPQASSLESGAHVVVGTPGRIEDHINKKTIDLSHVITLVLDEADRMLDMGFQPTLDAIIGRLRVDRQTLLFSATFPPEIESIAKRVTDAPVMTKVDTAKQHSDIDQRFYKVEAGARVKAMHLLLLENEPESCVVFCNTKVDVQEVADELTKLGFGVLALHGDLDQRQRDLVLVRFANKSASILVATDVAARGLDIEALDLVINYQIARDLDVHTHRVGRTGRAGSSGLAITLYSEKEQFKLAQLGEQLGLHIASEALPSKATLNKVVARPAMITIQIDGGRKQKVRPGDILGALTGDAGIAGADVGKIQINDYTSYVAVQRHAIKAALSKLSTGKIKGRSFKVRSL